MKEYMIGDKVRIKKGNYGPCYQEANPDKIYTLTKDAAHNGKPSWYVNGSDCWFYESDFTPVYKYTLADVKGWTKINGKCTYKNKCDGCPIFGIGHSNTCQKTFLKLTKGDKQTMTTLKTTITLKELIEQGACKEGVLWFMDNANEFRVDTRKASLGDWSWVRPYCTRSISEECKNKTDYIQWLKEHGYAVDDKQDKIAELKKEVCGFEQRIHDIQDKIKELENE